MRTLEESIRCLLVDNRTPWCFSHSCLFVHVTLYILWQPCSIINTDFCIVISMWAYTNRMREFGNYVIKRGCLDSRVVAQSLSWDFQSHRPKYGSPRTKKEIKNRFSLQLLCGTYLEILKAPLTVDRWPLTVDHSPLTSKIICEFRIISQPEFETRFQIEKRLPSLTRTHWMCCSLLPTKVKSTFRITTPA